ncbi:MAG: peptidylprolyl isomerase [Bacteroidales bacterium]|nr:peptidylprolyl isomerase [Bacteroidales bacterium]MDD4236181.1 peptidylprolyl isomerase [Bacteroidales bacterium]
MKKKILISIFCITLFFPIQLIHSQEVIDQIVAIVGNQPILKSDIENQYIQMISQGYYGTSVDLKCEILEDLLFQKLLLIQAQKDSIEVGNKEVESELNRRLSVFINQVGSEQKLEEYYGKSIVQIKEEFRSIIKDQLLTQRMQAKLTEDVEITPSEVKSYYEDLHPDSIPIIEESYELSQIVKIPGISEQEKNNCISKLEEIRDRIINGEKFSTMAILYSQDPGSASKGGELGFVSRTDLVPEFSAVAFSLTNTEDVSRIVKTDFGYHIIQLIERKGEMVNIRHILIVPETDQMAIDSLKNELSEIRKKILSDSVSFENAAELYSDDEETSQNNGKIMNPYTGSGKFTPDMLDVPTNRIIKKLQEGEISNPFVTNDLQGKTVVKIIKIDQKVTEHLATIEEDYQELYEYALNLEQQKTVKKWIKDRVEKTYIKIDESYKGCEFIYADWNK